MLSSTEVDRIRYELGYPVTRIGAEPYITFAAVFDKAIIPYLTDVGSTSATSVTASTTGALVTLVVAANPTLPQFPGGSAFVPNAKVYVDLGPNNEIALIQAVSGVNVSLTLFNAHTGTYPVVLAGAEQIVRDILTRLDAVQTEMVNTAPKTAGLSALVGEVEFDSSMRGSIRKRNRIDDLVVQRELGRNDLADAIGLPNLRNMKRSNGKMELY